jgi:hypothetical protein
MHSQKSTKREEIPEGPPIDEELRDRCENVHSFYCNNVKGYILGDVYYPETVAEVREIVESTPKEARRKHGRLPR